jgi:endo-1,3-1,4-beta-glycanase ExoK
VRRLLASLWVAASLLSVAVPARAVSSAELYQTQAEFYGRFEARIRFAPGDGVISSFFLWKSGSDASGAYWNELDFEKLGADCHLQTNAIFGMPSAQHSQLNATASDLCGSYHTYGFEWAPTYISWQIDGTEVRRDTGANATAFAQNASAGMQIHFNVWPGDASFGGNFNAAILPVHQYVSWVQYSSYANDSFSVAWREDFDSASVPSGWATGNWASPKGYSTHAPGNVNFVDGISILSLTSDAATGFMGAPPADGSGGGSGSSGASTGGVSGQGASAGNGGTSAGNGGASGAPGPSGGAAGLGAGGLASAGLGRGQSSGAAGAANVGSGGAQSAAGASANTGAQSGAATPTGSAGSCSCRLASTASPSSAWSLLSLGALAALRRRRRTVAFRRQPGISVSSPWLGNTIPARTRRKCSEGA